MVLVPFAAEGQREAVRDILFDLGVSVTVMPREQWLADRCNESGQIEICLFQQDAIGAARRDVLHALSRPVPPPRLGLFAGKHHHWDREILGRCHEFSSWPCPATELALRLCRLKGDSSRQQGAAVCGPDVAARARFNLVGASPRILDALERTKRFAECDAPVLIEGETGTGKELIARMLHYLGPRSTDPFIPVNCGALPDSLLENELFGHQKGAFTDAKANYAGLVVQAEGGTLFLDEVSSLSPRAQASLLRFLQESEYRPLGHDRVMSANVRVVSASNISVRDLQRDPTFRDDLLYRLNILPVFVPPLRDRGSDVLLLAEHFMERFRQRYKQPMKRLAPDSLAKLRRYSWPGNVRELENCIHRDFLLSDGSLVRLRLASWESGEVQPSEDTFRQAKQRAVEQFERDYLWDVMTRARGNVTAAASMAKKERRAFGKLLKKHGVDRCQFSPHSS